MKIIEFDTGWLLNYKKFNMYFRKSDGWTTKNLNEVIQLSTNFFKYMQENEDDGLLL